jgi:broad specificity phosphatase PhoE
MTGQRVALIRHGETVANEAQLAYGRLESPLNDRGIAQVRATAQALKTRGTDYHHIVSSPLGRALETANLIADTLQLPISIEADLVECDLGEWEGITYLEMHERGYAVKSIQDDHFREHGGESPFDISERVKLAMLRLLGEHPGQNLILVGHGGAFANGLSALLGSGPRFGPKYLMHNAAITELTFEQEPTILTLNEYAHLPHHLKNQSNRPDNAQQA